MKRTGKTASELMEELQRDPAYTDRLGQTRRRQAEARNEYDAAAATLLGELRVLGYSVDSVGHLARTTERYDSAIPTLVRWLPRVDYAPLKEDIVRALGVPWAGRQAAAALLRQFEVVDDPGNTGIRWAIANALEAVADSSDYTAISALVLDKKYGRAREMLVLALGNMGIDAADAQIVDLLQDDELAGYAAMAAGKRRIAEARPKLEALARGHAVTWVRSEARRALVRLSRSERAQHDTRALHSESGRSTD